jgi:hypothetical protein
MLLGVVVAAAVVFGSASESRAADVTVGDGIVVVDLTADESKKVFEAVDSATAFAALVSGALPPEYAIAVKLAAGGWQTLRLIAPGAIPLRVVVTAVPPAILLVPLGGVTGAEVVQTYGRIREQVSAFPRTAIQDTLNATTDRLDAARRELNGFVSNSLLVSALQSRVPVDQVQRWVDRLPTPNWHPRGARPAPGRLEANRDRGGEWERLTVLAHPDGTVSFRSHTGFLCAECGGGECVACNRPWAREWEKWTVVKGGDGTVKLRSAGGHYLRADDRGVVSSTEGTKFTLEFADGYVYLKTPSGKYLSAQP